MNGGSYQRFTYDLRLMWNILIDEYNVPENTLKLMTTINGYSSETLHDPLYAVAGNPLFDFEDPDRLPERKI